MKATSPIWPLPDRQPGGSAFRFGVGFSAGLTESLQHTVIISLGSNIGDRRAHLSYALTRLQATPGLKLDRLSSLYETEPWGNTEQAKYLNAVAAFKTRLEPISMLDLCQAIEAERGRSREVKWGPRTLDLDLISYDQLVMETERLILLTRYPEENLLRFLWRK